MLFNSQTLALILLASVTLARADTVRLALTFYARAFPDELELDSAIREYDETLSSRTRSHMDETHPHISTRALVSELTDRLERRGVVPAVQPDLNIRESTLHADASKDWLEQIAGQTKWMRNMRRESPLYLLSLSSSVAQKHRQSSISASIRRIRSGSYTVQQRTLPRTRKRSTSRVVPPVGEASQLERPLSLLFNCSCFFGALLAVYDSWKVVAACLPYAVCRHTSLMLQPPPIGWTQFRPSLLCITILSPVDERAIAIRDQKSVKEPTPLGVLPGEAFPQKKRPLSLLQSITICVLSIYPASPPTADATDLAHRNDPRSAFPAAYKVAFSSQHTRYGLPGPGVAALRSLLMLNTLYDKKLSNASLGQLILLSVRPSTTRDRSPTPEIAVHPS
ncbi:hypothetical protein NMY22_g12860 [Coprinellus aureogranulatus]|nr:hypothetical protein NMY22_g12860 [Coprinellus aureogranulatus]